MNPEAEAVLKKILDKDRSELTAFDISFLRARRKYVGKKSREKFADVFNDKDAQPVLETPQTEDVQEAPSNDTPYTDVDQDDDGEDEV